MKKPHLSYHSGLKQRARHLRKQGTLGEVLLWKHLRGRQMQGYDFHRQRPIDRYIVDFFCPALMLAIEIDGLSHRLAEGRERDLPRQQRLEALGVRFLRFSEREVLQEMPSVLQRIAEGIAWLQQLDQDQ